MIRRNFLSAFAGWLFSPALLGRWRSKSAVEPTPEPIAMAPTAFDPDIWRKHLERMICERVPGVTFGKVAKVPLDDDGIEHPPAMIECTSPEGYLGKNGLYFAFIVGDEVRLNGDMDGLSACMHRSLVDICDWLVKLKASTSRGEITCEIKDFEMLRLQMSFEEAVRGSIFADVIDPKVVTRGGKIYGRAPYRRDFSEI